MIFRLIFGSFLVLVLTALASAGNIGIPSITEIATIVKPGDAVSNNDDMAQFLTVISNVGTGDAETVHDSDPGSQYKKHVGLGFALSMNNSSPAGAACSVTASFPEPSEHRDCGEPSPAD